MSLIEGLGDEVTIAFIILTLIVVAVIAWVSTHTREIPFISVIVVELSRRTELNRRAAAAAAASNSAVVEHQVVAGDGLSASEINTLASENASSGDHVTESSNENASSDNVNVLANENVSSDNVFPSANQVSDDGTEIANENEGAIGLETTIDEPIFHDNAQPETDKSSTKRDEHCECDKLNSEKQKGDADSSINEHNTTGSVTPSELRHRRLAFFDSSKQNDKAEDSSQHSDKVSDISKGNDKPGDSSKHVPSGASCSTESVDVHPQPQSSGQTADTQQGTEDTQQGTEDTHESEIRVRLKYLNDTQRLVYTRPSQTVQEFRRTHFASELANNKLVRFIFNGQDLRNDGFTLQSYNIVDNSVVHCLVTQTQQTPHVVPVEDDLDIGHMMLPLFGFILSIIWYLRFSYRQYFNAMSTLCLVGVTFLFFLGVISSWQGRRRRTHLD